MAEITKRKQLVEDVKKTVRNTFTQMAEQHERSMLYHKAEADLRLEHLTREHEKIVAIKEFIDKRTIPVHMMMVGFQRVINDILTNKKDFILETGELDWDRFIEQMRHMKAEELMTGKVLSDLELAERKQQKKEDEIRVQINTCVELALRNNFSLAQERLDNGEILTAVKHMFSALNKDWDDSYYQMVQEEAQHIIDTAKIAADEERIRSLFEAINAFDARLFDLETDEQILEKVSTKKFYHPSLRDKALNEIRAARIKHQKNGSTK